MSNVLIIKNNDVDSDISIFAKESFQKKTKRYYNVLKDTPSYTYVKEIKAELEGNELILFITHNGKSSNEIKEIYIGSEVDINENNNIGYIMKIHMTNQYDKRAIESIVEKIDLNLLSDFEYNHYIIMSKMDSLYEELRLRLLAQNELRMLTECLGNKSNDEYIMNPLAQKDAQAIRIYSNEPLTSDRTEFQRDRERIVNCKAFRRLVDKAQIFGAEKGDYYRTRMTHSLEVNQIAKAISFALGLNLDLTEAIALGHDIGHTPYGHQGERTLDDILSGEIDVGLCVSKDLLKERCFGGFKHNYQSARILTQLEEKYVDFPGLNVSTQVIEGVLKHTRLKKQIAVSDFLNEAYLSKINISKNYEQEICSTLEGQVVAIADEIAQRGHDVDDALTSGVMSFSDFIDCLKIAKCEELEEKVQNELKNIENSNRLIYDKKDLRIARIVTCIVNYFINSTIEYSKSELEKNQKLGKIKPDNSIKMISFLEKDEKVNLYLERVVQKKVICNNEVARADYNANMIVKTLFEKYYSNPRLLHEGTIRKIFMEMLKHKNGLVSSSAVYLADGGIKVVNDEIREMTKTSINEKAVREYLKTGIFKGNEKDIIIFEKRKILVRAITDFIAGMTDGYALEEYNMLM